MSKPWWREPWPWILMAGPFVALIACLITVVLANQDFAAQTIADGGRKQGLVVFRPTVDEPAPAVSPACEGGTPSCAD